MSSDFALTIEGQKQLAAMTAATVNTNTIAATPATSSSSSTTGSSSSSSGSSTAVATTNPKVSITFEKDMTPHS
jgi:hypothetical protein